MSPLKNRILQLPILGTQFPNSSLDPGFDRRTICREKTVAMNILPGSSRQGVGTGHESSNFAASHYLT